MNFAALDFSRDWHGLLYCFAAYICDLSNGVGAPRAVNLGRMVELASALVRDGMVFA